MRKLVLASVCTLMATFASREASAADCDNPIANPCIDLETSMPTGHDNVFANIPRVDIDKDAYGSVRIWNSYTRNSLLTSTPGGGGPGTNLSPSVGSRATTSLGGSVFAWNRLALDVVLPISWYQDGGGAALVGGSPLPTSSIGDLRLGLTGMIHRTRDIRGLDFEDGIALGVRGGLHLPTATAAGFAGSTSPVGALSSTLSLRKGRWLGSFMLGARIREASDYLDLRVGSQLEAGAGFGVEVLGERKLVLGAELHALLGLYGLRDVAVSKDGYVALAGSRVHLPTEWAFIARTVPWKDLSFTATFGTSIPWSDSTALGSPAYRATLSIGETFR
ncbi:MAG: hypothetical protein U0174_23340 [Polyangiaceae bacterium]